LTCAHYLQPYSRRPRRGEGGGWRHVAVCTSPCTHPPPTTPRTHPQLSHPRCRVEMESGIRKYHLDLSVGLRTCMHHTLITHHQRTKKDTPTHPTNERCAHRHTTNYHFLSLRITGQQCHETTMTAMTTTALTTNGGLEKRKWAPSTTTHCQWHQAA
jgi:hypothetical protein